MNDILEHVREYSGQVLNQIIFDKDIGIFQNIKNPSVYKKYLSLNTIPNQRVEFESKMEHYIQIWHENSKRNNIL